jgi:stearoyl-CoA desaturase (delta-9 desaturase)
MLNHAFTAMEVQEQVKMNGKKWIIVDEHVVDLEQGPIPIWNDHPGGQSIFKAYLGKDASRAFHGELNRHTHAARIWMHHLRIGRVVPDHNKLD